MISARDLDRPTPRAHPMIASYLEKRVEALDVRPKRWDERVTEVVRGLLADGDCTVERVAEHFGCNRRGVHRHLAECGTSFSEILDAERDGAMVQGPLQPQRHRMAQRRARAGAGGDQAMVGIDVPLCTSTCRAAGLVRR